MSSDPERMSGYNASHYDMPFCSKEFYKQLLRKIIRVCCNGRVPLNKAIGKKLRLWPYEKYKDFIVFTEDEKKVTQILLRRVRDMRARHKRKGTAAASGRFSQGIREIKVTSLLRIIIRDEINCVYCCKELGTIFEITFDHRVPVSNGGLSTFHNLLVACYQCNTDKSNRSQIAFILDRFFNEEGKSGTQMHQ